MTPGLREVGQRPDGVVVVRVASTDSTEVWLGGRKLFQVSAFDLIASEVVVDWNDLDRFALQDDQEPRSNPDGREVG